MPGQIRRGEIYWVNWNPARGSEQAGRRPALIIQNDIGNRASPTTIVAACTTAQAKPYPFLVPLPAAETGLPKDCVANLSAILTIDQSRLLDRAGTVSEASMAKVDEAVKISLALD